MGCGCNNDEKICYICTNLYLTSPRMTLKQRYDGVIEWFSANMPSAESELHYENPYQLLVAVMLSMRTMVPAPNFGCSTLSPTA